MGVSHARSDGLAHLKPDYTPDGAALESTEMWGRGEPRQGRKIVAQGASPGEGALTPPTASLSPRGGERGRGEGGAPVPTAGAVGYDLPPAARAGPSRSLP